MEEQNKNIENQQPENENNETAIQTKKPIHKKTIIIASIVAAVAIIATIVCIIAFGKSPKEKAIIGEWYCPDFGSMCIKFLDDNTAELSYGSRIVDMEWQYDKEKQNYRSNAGGERITFTMRTEAGITCLDSSAFGYWFRADDKNLDLETSSILRNNIINRKLQDKVMINLGEAFSTENATIVFNSVTLNDDKKTVNCGITVTAKKNLSAEDLKNLIDHDRNICFESTSTFMSEGVGGSGKRIITECSLTAGESENFTFEIYVRFSDIEKWGIYHGYSVFEIMGTEYRLDLREYTKQ